MLEVRLAQMNEGVKDATVTYWLAEEGDTVQEGQDLVELMVDGSAIKVTTPRSGILNEVFFTEGDAIAVGDVLCEIDDGGEG